MITVKVKIPEVQLGYFQRSLEVSVLDQLDTIHYLDYYNLRWLTAQIEIMKAKYLQTLLNAPQKPKQCSVKMNVNVAVSYLKVINGKTQIWEDLYLSSIHLDVIAQIDKRLKTVEKIV